MAQSIDEIANQERLREEYDGCKPGFVKTFSKSPEDFLAVSACLVNAPLVDCFGSMGPFGLPSLSPPLCSALTTLQKPRDDVQSVPPARDGAIIQGQTGPAPNGNWTSGQTSAFFQQKY